MSKKPFLLMILDGWGASETVEHNAIKAANTPVWDKLIATSPNTLLSGSGLDVGLPETQMGNSEVGHVNIGSGRIVYQELTRIDKAIADQDFCQNTVLSDAMVKAVKKGGRVHLIGLLSPGGVHSHERHFHALVDMAEQKGVDSVFVHAFLDGRDVPPRSAHDSLERMDAKLKTMDKGYVASVIGRYYAMDRDQRWDRVQSAYDMLIQGDSVYQAHSALEALEMAYARDENDEFVKATCVVPKGQVPVTINDNDTIIFVNFRADRARELSSAFANDNFNGFERQKRPGLADFVMMTEYSTDISANIAYKPVELKNVLGEVLSNQGKTQLRIAETEKYAHVTFFFNGGVETPFAGEDRILVPSPKVATYDLQPEMNAPELTRQLIAAIDAQKYDVIICNYANADMVGHTGNFDATVKAIEALDTCIGKVIEALERVGGQALITADHGNADKMLDEETGQAHTAHTHAKVPLVYVGSKSIKAVSDHGVLSDIAPTLLALISEQQPIEMTGHILFKQ